MTTDKTAKTLLESNGKGEVCLPEFMAGREFLPIADLQAFARLWLMLPEMRESIEYAIRLTPAANRFELRGLLARLSDEALRGKSDNS